MYNKHGASLVLTVVFFFRNLKNMEIITEKDKLLNIKETKYLTSHTVTELKNK